MADIVRRDHPPPSLRPLAAFVRRQSLVGGVLGGVMLGLSSYAVAGPEGGVVIAGEGSISHEAHQTHIHQASDELIMAFDSFDVDVDEAVLITQPGAHAWFFGRIDDVDASSILGEISANGQIALVNPHGIIFGETATVNAAGIFASALGVSADMTTLTGQSINFDAGETGGFVINEGVLAAATGGQVMLLGETVSNSGVVMATLGQINLSSGSAAVVSFGNEGLIGIELTEAVLKNNERLAAAIENTGSLTADGGRVLLQGSVTRGLFDQAINTSGVIRASSGSTSSSGKISLFADGGPIVNSGVMDARGVGSGDAGLIAIESDTAVSVAGDINVSSETGGGGDILVGAPVVTVSGADIRVDGATSGGTVMIAGGEISIDASTLISAEAIQSGNGGEVDIRGDHVQVSSPISVRGRDGGSGGTVRVTASEDLVFDAPVDLGGMEAGALHLSAPELDVSAQGTDVGNVHLHPDVHVGDLTLEADRSVSIAHDLTIDGGLSVAVGDALSSGDAAFVLVEGTEVHVSGGTSVVVESADANHSLIDVAGVLKGGPIEPLPNAPLAPSDRISLTATNGRVRVRGSGRIDVSETEGGSIDIRATSAHSFTEDLEVAGQVLIEGVLDATSDESQGNTISVYGDLVGLTDSAVVLADGGSGGGVINIGGGYQGTGAVTAFRTFVGPQAQLSASALIDGDGGEVIVWADDTTRFHGQILARGAGSGDGGFVEVSGAQYLVYRGHVDTAAPSGTIGTLLLDPDTITIAGGTGTATVVLPTVNFTDGGVVETIYEENLEDQVSAVTLQARQTITFTGTFDHASGNPGDAPGVLAMASGVALSLSTQNDTGTGTINTAATDLSLIQLTNATLSLTTGAAGGGTMDAPIDLSGVAIDIGGVSGDLVVSSNHNLVVGDLDVAGAVVLTFDDDGNNTSTLTLGAVTTMGAFSVSNGDSTAIDTVSLGGSVSAASIVVSDVVSTTLTAGESYTAASGDLNLDGGGGVGSVVLDGTGTVLLDHDGTGASTLSLPSVVDSGNAALTHFQIDSEGNVLSVMEINLDDNTSDGNLTVNAAGALSIGNISNTANLIVDNTGGSSTLGNIGAITLIDVTADSIQIGGVLSSASVDLDTSSGSGGLTDTFSGSIVANDVMLTTLDDDVELNSTMHDVGTLQISADTGAVTFVDANDLTVGASTTNGSLTLTADDIEITGAVSVGTTANLNASGGVGDIITSGVGDLSVAGTTTLQAQATDSIDLSGDFDSDDSGDAVSVTGTISALTLVDSDSIELGAASVTNALTVTGQGIEISGAVSAGSTTLDASGGDLTGTGSLSITGLAALTVTSTDVITLTTASNDFGELQINAGTGAVTINDDNAVDIGAST
ncbi:MAG: filamentous hemagglutinin N-terminal domain-containing protein, partial [Pseudomonadota bacterium]